MIGGKQLLIILIGASLFLGGLWFFTREDNNDIGIGLSDESSEVYKEINNKIVAFGDVDYNEDQLAKIKADITAAEMADQLETEEVTSMYITLNSSLMKSLNLSFNNLFSTSCYETGKLTSIVSLLKNQNEVNENTEAINNIDKYNNVRAFKSLETKVKTWMNMEYSGAYKDEVERKFALSGVSSCNGCHKLKVEILNELKDLEKMDIRYKDQVKRNKYYCTVFEGNKHYYNLLVNNGHCPQP